MKNLKRFLPDLLAIIAFMALSFAYFFVPATQGLVINGHDHVGALGAGVEMNDYQQRTGERTRWTNALFSGMPTYQMAPSYTSTQTLVAMQKVYQLGLHSFVMYVFVMLLGFYIMLRAFNFKVWMAALGAILWAFSSYFFIIIGAGHIWKLLTLAYIPPTIAGMVWCYRGRYLWGAVVTAFFMALQILSNHLQMTYYFVPVMLAVALAYLIKAVQDKQTGRWVKASAALFVAVVIGVACNLSNLYHTYQYSQQSMRSKSELTSKTGKNPANQTKDGLERDYITNWSYGVGETWSLLVPNVKGGASVPLTASTTAMEKANPQYTPVYQALTQYWGEQPGTSGPVYVGALVIMLALLALFIVRGPLKWMLLVLTLFSVMLSWGRNFMWLTNLFLDYIPMYDKFRSVSSILVVAEFTLPLLAMLALKEMVEHPEVLKRRLPYVYVSFALTGGIALLFALAPDACFGNYLSTSEQKMLQGAVDQGYIPGDMFGSILANLHEMRKAVLVADAWRSVFITVLGLLLILAYNINKVRARVLVGGVLVICLVDLWQINKRYLNDGMFSAPLPTVNALAKSEADEQILQDPDPYYRVMNLAGNPFNENNTSYYHKSIGGYHAAKLRRYQEMIEEHIAPEMSAFARATAQAEGDLRQVNGDSIFPVLNMLNTKYAIMGREGAQTFAIPNPHAFGNAWFVDRVEYVDNADEEIQALHHLNPRHVAVVNRQYSPMLQGCDTPLRADSTYTVRLTRYEANALDFEVEAPHNGVLVFSDIYYPGWQATIDGEPADIACADYILRAMPIRQGKHRISMWFDPTSLHTTEAVATTCIWLLIAMLVFLAGRTVVRRRQASKAEA